MLIHRCSTWRRSFILLVHILDTLSFLSVHNTIINRHLTFLCTDSNTHHLAWLALVSWGKLVLIEGQMHEVNMGSHSKGLPKG
jgi:hypothetical protein